MKQVFLIVMMGLFTCVQLEAKSISIKNIGKLLVEANILDESYPQEHICHFQKIDIKEGSLVLVKIENNGELVLSKGANYLNVIMYVNKEGKRQYKSIPSIEVEDFQFQSTTFPERNCVFSYYSSPVGYSEYFILSSQAVLLKSPQIDEGKRLNIHKDINVKERFLKVSENNKIEKLGLEEVKWKSF